MSEITYGVCNWTDNLPMAVRFKSPHLFAAILLLSASLSGRAQEPAISTGQLAAKVDDALAFVDLPEAGGKLDRERARTCLALLLGEFKIANRALPHIVVIHADRKLADAAGVTRTSIRRNTAPAGANVYYELWIVGKPTVGTYAVMLQGIVEQHFALQLTEQDRDRILARVLRYLQNTVSARRGG